MSINCKKLQLREIIFIYFILYIMDLFSNNFPQIIPLCMKMPLIVNSSVENEGNNT